VRSVVPEKYLDEDTIYHIQPSGHFLVGGPMVSGNGVQAEHQNV